MRFVLVLTTVARAAVVALGALALGTYFMYGGRMAQKQIEKGAHLWMRQRSRAASRVEPRCCSRCCPCDAGGDEIKSTADAVKSACAWRVVLALLRVANTARVCARIGAGAVKETKDEVVGAVKRR